MPAPSRRSWRDWVGLKPRSNASSGSIERRPQRFKRESTAELLTAIWGGVGFVFIRTGAEPAVGRCLQMQAPVAGGVLEDITKGTLVDRPLQWVARNTDNAEATAALFALPALVYLYPRVPDEARPMVEMLMQEATLAHLKAMVPMLKKKRARERELAKVLEDLKAEGAIDPDTENASDAVDAILNAVFSAPAQRSEPEPDTNGDEPGAERVHEPAAWL
jgi:hypothetical protein